MTTHPSISSHPSSIYQRPSPPGRPATPRVAVAFLARVSTDDQQDPTLSLPRQLANCQAALPEGWEIVAWFWDIESGRTSLERRGRSRAHEHIAVPLPRDGGLLDLLAEAEHPGRRFNVVICESIDRLARRTYVGTGIEHQLEQAGVRLYAADEPIDPRGKRSTGLLTRRVKQGVAEWYVLDMLERSWDGFKVHTGQGWNIGKPPYGYAAQKIEHPVPAKAAEGLTKTRLVPDPQRAPVVAHIFRLRVVERLGFDAIAARLNRDHDRYPVPEPTSPHRRRGTWSGSAVRDIVTNPKYTGYMVWNRRATKSGGRINPPEAWVWSEQPTHEPLVTRETFEAAAQVARLREGSRNAAGPNAAHRQTKRGYLLRSYVRCWLCDHRMFGKTRRGHAYYCCYPAGNNADRLDRYPADHPKAIYVREDALTEALDHVIATRIFGPDRHALLRRELADRPGKQRLADAARADALREQIADLAARQDRLIVELETTNPADRAFRDRLRGRFDALEAERADKTAQLEALEAASHVEPEQDIKLLDGLPLLPHLNITEAPERTQRKLYDALQLQIHYDRPDQARFRIALTDDTVEMLTEAITGTPANEPQPDAHLTAAPPGAPLRSVKTWVEQVISVRVDLLPWATLGRP
ncbi:recombinase family protein [Planosporangium flavigriseum]|uniref:Recombinase n=1 Tax=Planosporangium flavigriseum TaxID=373681 RepID=A0A8J3PMA2_9ACTN|nr:recombinase family protein [Planosporangium flavigriseum]NJC64686.1 recombinase family protein [Planosporangium flavigriseum]GIG74089.1 recombinase [Planosporangium flavigriseum]